MRIRGRVTGSTYAQAPLAAGDAEDRPRDSAAERVRGRGCYAQRCGREPTLYLEAQYERGQLKGRPGEPQREPEVLPVQISVEWPSPTR